MIARGTFFRLQNPWLWLAFGLAIVLLRGLFLDVMDVDASQYASISMEMLQNGRWLQVQHRGADYLDKPPLLFWLSAGSFGLFGLSNWAYKLPSFLAALAGVWATYRFTLLYYDAKTAHRAAFVLASSLGFVLLCNDVRTDTLLLGFSACAVWQLAEYLEFKRWKNLLAGFVCIGMAMLAKGPIGLVMPALAVGSHLLWRRDWRGIFQWQWLVGLLATTLVLLPMCWGLWQQFDLHPEKLVNERHGVSGLRFYFWEQSFGRITGENVWKNDTSGFYFVHVYLWAFLPWCLLLPGALLQSIRQKVTRFWLPGANEAYSLGGFLLTFIALSQSQYKLPHYIFITLPWAAVLVAARLQTVEKMRWAALYVAGGAALSIAFITLFYVFPGHFFMQVITIAGTTVLLWRILRQPFPAQADVLVQRGVAVALIFGVVLNFHFYPCLLPYQSTTQVAAFARSKNIPPEKMYFFRRGGHALDFYNSDILESIGAPEEAAQKARERGEIWIFTTTEGKMELENAGLQLQMEGRFPDFHVSLLKPKFLNPDTRSEVLREMYLLKLIRN
ncbi:MAG: glycosyltransferase family 39 protein [Saprospiraceae bacterium]|nr:glycosyltransferase family 39 protein [Saprospiraceae bacterium]